MRRLRYILLGTCLAVGWTALPASGQLAAPGAGITDSLHDFTSAANTAAHTDHEEASICIFCHVQHRFRTVPAETSRLLWNHKLSANTFGWSDITQTYGGTLLPTNLGTWGGTTKNCLSCHDGTVSIGDLYRPSGKFTAWTGTHVTAAGIMNVTGKSHFIGGGTGDLKGNHPVGVPYPYGGVVNTYNSITTGDRLDLSDYVAAPVNVKLFTDIGNDVIQGASAGSSGIECASCHDVHNKHVVEEHLLRDYYDTAGSKSQICLDCHAK